MSDNKFLTSAQPKVMNPKENIKMTPEERTEGRKGLKTAVVAGLSMFPGGRAMKTVDRVGNAFANTARQYMRGGKVAKPVSNFKPFHRGGRVYDRQAINDAFKARFGPQANPAIRPPKIQGTNFGRADAQVKMREAYRSLKK